MPTSRLKSCAVRPGGSGAAAIHTRGEETPGDVVAGALTRTWIDRPAIAVRAELRSARSTQDDGDGRDRLERPLGQEDLRRLLERAAVLDRTITGAQTELEMARHRLVSLARERTALSRSIEEYEGRLATARRTIAELDRPLVGRRHRVELGSARNQLGWVPRSMHEAKEKLAQVDVQERLSGRAAAEGHGGRQDASSADGRAGGRAEPARPRCPAAR